MTSVQRLRFSFETATLRRAVHVAGELRQLTSSTVQVRPSPTSREGSCRWAILVTTDLLEASAIAAVEAEMRRLAWRGGLSFTGWLYLSGRGEPESAREPAASSAGQVRVLIVDDSAPFRRAARNLLESHGYAVVGEAGSAASGFAQVERLEPDAVLLDVRLPDGSGLDLCEVITREDGAPAVLIVSSDNGADAALAQARGARGYVSKADLARVDLHAIWA